MAPNNPLLSSSPLNQQSRQGIVGSGGAGFQGVGASAAGFVTPQSTVSAEDIKTLQVTEQNQEILNGINFGLNGVRQDINSLNNGLVEISTLIQNDAASEQRFLLNEQERERILSEQEVRTGKESVIEKKIDSAFSSAASRVSTKVRSLFDRVGQAILYLFGGWIATKYAELLEAEGKDNVDLVQQIKSQIAEGSKSFLNSFILLGGGFSKVISKILSLGKNIGSFLLKKPFEALWNLGSSITSRFTGNRSSNTPPPSTPGGPKPQGPKSGGPKISGGFGTALSAGAEALTGNYVEAGLGAAAFIPGWPGKIAKVAFWGEQVLDMFGKGFLGNESENPKKESEEPAMMVKPDTAGGEVKVEANPTKPDTAGGEVKVEANPTKPDTAGGEVKVEANPAKADFKELKEDDKEERSSSTPSTINTSALFNKDDSEKGTIFGFDTKSLFSSSSSDSSQSSTEKASVEPQEKASVEPQEKASVEPQEKALPNVGASEQSSPEMNTQEDPDSSDAARYIEAEKNINAPPVVASSENVQAPPKEVNPLPELKEPPVQVVSMNSGGSQSPMPVSIPGSNESITDIPLISSSNPENFYTLYSLHSYNVVV